jgi:hypothetical protein
MVENGGKSWLKAVGTEGFLRTRPVLEEGRVRDENKKKHPSGAKAHSFYLI